MPTSNFLTKTEIDPISKKPTAKPDLLKIGLLALICILALLVIIGLVNLTIKSLQPAPKKEISSTNADQALELEKKKQKEASAASQLQATPVAKLTKAYQEIVGSLDFLRDVSFENGLGTVRYTINSKENRTILITGYQNFADFASTIFHSISELEKLKLIIYATGIVDAQGQANTPAMTLEISRTKNDQINWQVNKYRYDTYSLNLEVNDINSALSTEYYQLVKKN